MINSFYEGSWSINIPINQIISYENTLNHNTIYCCYIISKQLDFPISHYDIQGIAYHDLLLNMTIEYNHFGFDTNKGHILVHKFFSKSREHLESFMNSHLNNWASHHPYFQLFYIDKFRAKFVDIEQAAAAFAFHMHHLEEPN